MEAAVRIHKGLCEEGYEDPDIQVYIKFGDQDGNDLSGDGMDPVLLGKEDDLKEYVSRAFEEAEALIFICACGIAVRLIAPFIVHKARDPAVIVIDEKLKHCIPVLSGHLGGANALALRIASFISNPNFFGLYNIKNLLMNVSVRAVIAFGIADINGMTAVDMFAKDNGFAITDLEKAKEYTAALLSGETLYVINDAKDVTGEMILPEGYAFTGEPDGMDSLSGMDDRNGMDGCNITDDRCVIRITYKGSAHADACDRELILIPRCLKLGIGCRKGVSKERIEEAAVKCFEKHGLYLDAVSQVCSIDLKKDEEGISEFSLDRGIGFTVYPADELNALEGDFSRSDFVKDHTGVDNVCERSALMEGGRLLVGKEKYDGITLAVAAVARPVTGQIY